MKKGRRREKKKKVNLILSHVIHTFFILDLQIGTPAFRHTHCTLGMCFFKCEKRSNLRFNLLQIGPWAFGPWTLV